MTASMPAPRRAPLPKPIAEHRELAGIYVRRGLEPTLADQVASQPMARDALAAHARNELGSYARSANEGHGSEIGATHRASAARDPGTWGALHAGA